VKLCQHADLSEDDKNIIVKMQTLGVPIIHEVCLSRRLSLYQSVPLPVSLSLCLVHV